jgi:hypothetical protein
MRIRAHSPALIEPLEARLCLSSTSVTLSAHQRHVLHQQMLDQGSGSGIAVSTTFSAHQLHVSHVVHLHIGSSGFFLFISFGNVSFASTTSNVQGTTGSAGNPFDPATFPVPASSFNPTLGTLQPFGGSNPMSGRGQVTTMGFNGMATIPTGMFSMTQFP